MAEWIEYPPEMRGEPDEQLRQVYLYLRKLAEQLNSNQDVTDENLREYINAQANAVRNVTGEKMPTEQGSVKDMAAELVAKLQEMLQKLQRTTQNTVTRENFTELFLEKARTVSATEISGPIITGISGLQSDAGEDEIKIGKLLDMTSMVISYALHGFFYCRQNGTDANDNPIYETAIGKDVITWNSQGVPSYDRTKAWVIFSSSGNTINGSGIATQAHLANKEDRYTTEKTLTDADSYDAGQTGKWTIEISSSSTNFPSALSSGDKILMEVESGGGIVLQKIWAGNGYLYTRMGQGTSWGGWYQFTGIAL